MRRGLVGVLTVILALGFPLESEAAPTGQPCCKRQVILHLLVKGASFDQAAMRPWPAPTDGNLGIGLLTAGDDREVSSPDSYEALGSGGGRRGSLQRALLAAGLKTGLSPGLPLNLEARSALFGNESQFGNEVSIVTNEQGFVSSDLFVFLGTLDEGGEPIPQLIGTSMADEILLITAVPVRTLPMQRRKDEVSPVLMARGSPDDFVDWNNPIQLTRSPCVPTSGCARGLTSDTTRRDGIVSNVDVAPTILEFLEVPIPDEMTGSPIRIEGEPPTRLHQRYLQYQRIHTPVGLLALAPAILTLLLSVAVLLAPWRAPSKAIRALGILALVSVALPVMMLPASLLPRLTYMVVLPTLAAGAALVTMVALLWGRGDPAAQVAIVAGLGLGVVILDGVLGWPAMMMPLLGDSALEGVRFYGMGNAFAGVYMAGAILLAARIPPVAGVALLAATGLLAGLPNFGAELGTSFTLFAAAGLWYMFRVRHRFGVREVAVAGAVALGGLAAVLLIHRFSPVPTHVTRVVEDATRSGVGEIFAVFGRRLALNVRNTSAIPFNWLVVATLPVWLAVTWKRLGPFGSVLRRDPAWRDATVILALSSVIGFLVNDSMGVAGLGYTYLSAALIYPALRERWTTSG